MKKENIIIIDAVSTASNYIHDARELGYNPICLELLVDKNDDEMFRRLYDKQYLLISEELPETIQAAETYEETLEKVKRLNPILIIPGRDDAIEWATKMAYDLGLPGNNPKNIKKMIDKQYMHEALKDSNLRYIKSKVINSFDEAEEFISQLDKSQVVIKPSFSTSTKGVCICKNDDEVKNAIAYNENLFSNKRNVNILIQEYIGGEEYIIDSVCCKGYNRVIAAFHYKKIIIENRGAIYDYAESIDETDPHFRELQEYNDKVLSAIGIDYGVTHAEYKIDENGPVLIEINCRVAGPSQNYSLLDSVWGEHQTALCIESYLNPEECIKKHKKPLKSLLYYITKDIIVYEEINVIKSNIEEIFKDLESYQYAISSGDNKIYPKTIDLSTAGGIVFLANKDKSKLLDDVNTIKRIEEFETEKLFDIEKK